jgi:hypothetical protein
MFNKINITKNEILLLTAILFSIGFSAKLKRLYAGANGCMPDSNRRWMEDISNPDYQQYALHFMNLNVLKSNNQS